MLYKGFIWITKCMGVSAGLISKILISFWIFKLQVPDRKCTVHITNFKFFVLY